MRLKSDADLRARLAQNSARAAASYSRERQAELSLAVISKAVGTPA
jgi:hypothetical protein